MPRFRNILTGSVVNVDDATAAQLGSEFEPIKPAESVPDEKPAPKRRAPARKK